MFFLNKTTPEPSQNLVICTAQESLDQHSGTNRSSDFLDLTGDNTPVIRLSRRKTGTPRAIASIFDVKPGPHIERGSFDRTELWGPQGPQVVLEHWEPLPDDVEQIRILVERPAELPVVQK